MILNFVEEIKWIQILLSHPELNSYKLIKKNALL